jgi:hypothetical protein
MSSLPPAGWYDDGSGRIRYWSGSAWTDQYAPRKVVVVQPSETNELSYLDRHPALIPLLLCAVLCLIGAGNLPYDYYRFLRITITVAGVFVIVHSVRSKQFGWLALGIPVVILFAPAVWVVLPAVVWKVLDVATAGLLILAGFLIRNPPAPAKDDPRRWEWWKVALLVFGIGWVALAIGVYGSSGLGDGCPSYSYDRSGPYCDG